MRERFSTVWQPVGPVQVSTLSRKVPDLALALALGRARRPGKPSSSALLPYRRSVAEEEEDNKEKEEEVEASDVSMDIEDEQAAL